MPKRTFRSDRKARDSARYPRVPASAFEAFCKKIAKMTAGVALISAIAGCERPLGGDPVPPDARRDIELDAFDAGVETIGGVADAMPAPADAFDGSSD